MYVFSVSYYDAKVNGNGGVYEILPNHDPQVVETKFDNKGEFDGSEMTLKTVGTQTYVKVNAFKIVELSDLAFGSLGCSFLGTYLSKKR